MQRSVGTPRGLTLIEIMAAMAISAILLAGAWQLFQGGMRSYHRGLQDVRMTHSARTLLRLVTQDIQRAMAAGVPYGIRSAVPPSPAVTPAAQQDERLALAFVAPTTAPATGLPRGEPARIRYVLHPGTERKTLALQRMALSVNPQQHERLMAVHERVQSFNVRYLDGQQWHDEWQRAELPRAVELTLVVQGEGAEARVSRFTTLVTAE